MHVCRRGARETLLRSLVLVGAVVSVVSGGTLATAGSPVAVCPAGCVAKPAAKPAWHVTETANFRILTYGLRAVSGEVSNGCEAQRAALNAKWLGSDQQAPWKPKCDIVLHPDDASYLREVGQGGGNTIASSLVDQRHGSVTLRRIDVRRDDRDWQTEALPHELTHVIVADCFVDRRLPRWIDEGLAILADPADKQLRHNDELRSALARRTAFRVVELMTLEDYPAAQRWGAFYGQSVSLVEFLVAQGTPRQFVEFAQLSVQKGYEPALKQVYGMSGIAELERRWNVQLASGSKPRRAADSVAAQAPGNAEPTPASPTRNQLTSATRRRG